MINTFCPTPVIVASVEPKAFRWNKTLFCGRMLDGEETASSWVCPADRQSAWFFRPRARRGPE